MTDLYYRESLLNSKTGELRVTFDTPNPRVHVVVKLFGDADEEATVKIFLGMYEKIKSHWRTIIPVEPSDEQWRMVRDAIRILLSDVYNLANRKETQR